MVGCAGKTAGLPKRRRGYFFWGVNKRFYKVLKTGAKMLMKTIHLLLGYKYLYLKIIAFAILGGLTVSDKGQHYIAANNIHACEKSAVAVPSIFTNYSEPPVAELYSPPSAVLTTPNLGSVAAPMALDNSANNSGTPALTTAATPAIISEDIPVAQQSAVEQPVVQQSAEQKTSAQTDPALNAGIMPVWGLGGGVLLPAADQTSQPSTVTASSTNTVNTSPSFEAVGSKSVNEGTSLTFTILATDTDGDAITYSATGLPSGATFNADTKTFTWTPDYSQSGEYSVVFSASDGNTAVTKSVTITVSNVNRPSEITPIENRSINENELLTFTIEATDPDGDSLRYSASSLPQGASFDVDTHTFTWAPDYNQAGSYPVTFTVTDGLLPAQETITITVINVNRPPTLNMIGDKTISENQLLVFTISATDPDGDAITYSAQDLPKGATFDANTHTFSWIPVYKQAGTYNVTFAVSDGNLSSSQTITITASFIDSDGDGLPDAWEMENFGNLNQAAHGDYDNDGLTNIEEYAAGTDPTLNSNVALGRTYTLSPKPNYSLCTNSGDITDLTDGFFAAQYWWDPADVGWYGIEYAAITIDLGSDQPVSGIKYYTQGQYGNVAWPEYVYVLVSDDNVNYYFLTDMAEDSPPPELVRGTGTYPPLTRHTFFSGSLDTHARYVRFMTFPESHFIFIDEIQVFSGGANLPYAGPTLPEDKALLESWFKLRWRFTKDIDMLRQKAALTGTDISGALENVAARVKAFRDPAGELPSFKTVFPAPLVGSGGECVGKMQIDLLKINAVCMRGEGLSGVVSWKTQRWDPVDMYTSPRPGTIDQPIAVNMMNGERRGEALNLTNTEDADKTVTISIDGFEAGNPDWIKVWKVQCTDTGDVMLISDMFLEMSRTDQGYELELPSGMTQQVWIEFAPQGKAAGTHAGIININDGAQVKSIGIGLHIAQYAFPEKLSLSLGMWDYIEALYPEGWKLYDLTTSNVEKIKEFLRYYKYDGYWATDRHFGSAQMTAAAFDASNKFVPPARYFQDFDNWVAMFPDMPIYYIFLEVDENGNFAGLNIFNDSDRPTCNARIKSWAEAWEDHLYSIGMDPERAAFLLVDEPGTSLQRNKAVIYWGKPLRDRPAKYGSKIQVWEDTSIDITDQAPQIEGDNVFTVSDILCPGVYLSYSLLPGSIDGKNRLDRYSDLRLSQGKKLEFYGGTVQKLDPYGYNIMRDWIAFKYGASAQHHWCVIDSGGSTGLNAYVQPRPIYTPLYFNGPNIYTSKHFEAIYEGREDYEYLMILTMWADYLRENDSQKTASIAEVEALRKDAIDAVVWGVFGENYSKIKPNEPDIYLGAIAAWSASRDRSVADTQRNIIWSKINELSAAYNIQSLHRIEVKTVSGGSITPGGTANYYYAPSKYVIVKNGEDKTFTITPDAGYRISYLIIDGKFGDVAQTYTFNGINASHSIKAVFEILPQINRPPVLDSIGDKSVSEGELLTFTLSASDPDGDAITYSAQDLPSGATFDANTHTFSWAPTYKQAGVYNVTFTVSDGNLSSSQTISITASFIDSDGDGLPDAWELENFGDLNQAADGDYDSDGLTNFEEYKSGTDPKVTNSNIALHKSYILDPAPNYSNGSQFTYPDGQTHDDTDLTDGVFMPSTFWALWAWPGSIGWFMYSDQLECITVDLASDQPIAAIKYSTVGRTIENCMILWPDNIYVLGSTDGVNYYMITDMIKNEPFPGYPADGAIKNHVFTSTGLDTHARYVKFIILKGWGGIHIDEIEIYGGGSNLPYKGGALPSDKDGFITAFRLMVRMQKDLDAVKQKADTTGVDLSSEIGLIQSRISGFDDFSAIPNMKTIMPQPSNTAAGQIQLDILKLNAKLIKNDGFSGTIVWNANRWDPLLPYTSPEPGVSIQPISLNMMNGERRGCVFNITNSEDTDKTVTIIMDGLEESDNPDFVKLYKVVYVDSAKNNLTGDLLDEVAKGASGYSIDIPSGMTRQVWLEFAPKALSEGSHSGAISVTDGGAGSTVNVNLSMGGYAFPRKLSLSLTMWDYFSQMLWYHTCYDLTTENYPAIKKMASEYGLSAHWADTRIPNINSITAGNFDGQNKFIPPADYFNIFDRWIQEFPDEPVYYIFSNVNASGDFAGTNMDTDPDLFKARVKGWAEAWEDHLYALGMDPSRVAFLLVDEPSTDDAKKIVIRWGQAIRDRELKYGLRIQVWEDAGELDPNQSLVLGGDTVYTVSDMLCPGFYSAALRNVANHTFEFYDNLRQSNGKKFQLYQTENVHQTDPYGYEMLMEWGAFKYGASTVSYWCLIDAGGCRNMNEYAAKVEPYTPLYLDGPMVYNGKHFESTFEGREDYEYLMILTMWADYLREQDPEAQAAISELETIRQNALKAVLDPVFGEDFKDVSETMKFYTAIDWRTSKDRSIADTQRDLIWNKINELSAAYNVQSLHRIEVKTVGGGSIDPGGTANYYYAPSKYAIVKNGEDKTFTITPDAGYRISYIIIDGKFSPVAQNYTQSYTFNDINASHSIKAVFEALPQINHPPVLDPIGDKSVSEGQPLTFTLSATDPDGDALTYSAQDLPKGATFDADTHTFSWTPVYKQAGAYNVTFTVSDGNLSSFQTITITVSFAAIPVIYAYTQDFETSDPFVFWAANGTYTENFKGLTDENASAGQKSFKLDLTLGTAGYVYYRIPIDMAINSAGELQLSGDIFVKSISGAATVSLGSGVGILNVMGGGVFGIDRLGTTTGWITQTREEVTRFKRFLAEWIEQYFGGAVVSDFGGWFESVGLYIWGEPGARVELYVDNINIDGTTLDGAAFKIDRKAAFDAYKIRAISEINQMADEIAAVNTDIAWVNAMKNEVSIARTNAVARGYPTPEEWRIVHDAYAAYFAFYFIFDGPMTDGYELFPWEGAVKSDRRILPRYLKLPAGASAPSGDTLSLKTTRGEFNVLSFGIKTVEDLAQVTVRASDFHGPGESVIPSSALDIRVVKGWYAMNDQKADRTSTISLVPELLLKDDSLVKVDEDNKMNFLKVTRDEKEEYMDITTPSGAFPLDAAVRDASTLQPFDVGEVSLKQLWCTLHVPKDTPSGDYAGTITVTPYSKPPKVMNVRVTILPFDLAPSLLEQSIYYTGQLRSPVTVSFINKTPAQLTAELADLRDHGVLNPTVYQPSDRLGEFLDIMKSVGLPTNHLYWLGSPTENPTSEEDLNALKEKVRNLLDIAAAHGFEDPYIYGMDEAAGDLLLSQRPAWQAVHEAGGKVFVAGSTGVFEGMGDLLDLFNSAGALLPKEAGKWHGAGRRIFSYANPLAGAKNPDIYRRSYGIDLLLAGYDGAMNWAYQSLVCYYKDSNIWNNFEDSGYGCLTMAFPTSDGVIDTIQWEGYREGVTDVRYLSTLIRMDQSRTKEEIIEWANEILAENPDLDAFRQTVIDEILKINQPVN